MLNENDIVAAVLNSSDMQDVLRVIARVAIREVALRANSAPPVEDVTVIGDMTIDRLPHTVAIAGSIRPLKPREFALIETLARRMGFVFSRGRLLDLAWPDPEGVDDERTVDVHIRRLRVKLGAAANIRTVRGIGYALARRKRADRHGPRVDPRGLLPLRESRDVARAALSREVVASLAAPAAAVAATYECRNRVVEAIDAPTLRSAIVKSVSGPLRETSGRVMIWRMTAGPSPVEGRKGRPTTKFP